MNGYHRLGTDVPSDPVGGFRSAAKVNTRSAAVLRNTVKNGKDSDIADAASHKSNLASHPNEIMLNRSDHR